jgi:hypothetical protein
MDTSPLKPERQSSSRYLTAARLQRRMSPATGSGGGPPPLRRTVSRTDSLMAPSGGALGRLSISSRRHSISEDAPDLNRHSPALLARTFSGSGDIMQQLQQQQQQQSQPSIPRSGGPSGCPPRRSVSRSESMARPRMPTLVRRDSITAADENPMERIRRQSITLPIDSIQEAVAVTNSMD